MRAHNKVGLPIWASSLIRLEQGNSTGSLQHPPVPKPGAGSKLKHALVVSRSPGKVVLAFRQQGNALIERVEGRSQRFVL